MKIEKLIQIVLDAIKGEDASADFWFDKPNGSINFTVTYKEERKESNSESKNN